MNNTIKLAVAAALVAAASTANAGISIPAGDWTLDIGGVVNAYYTSTRTTGAAATATTSNITTGLLPNYLSVSGKTRQNDLDVAFTISIQPGAATANAGTLGSLNQRQAFLTFGDASWGSIKLGKDLGIYASDAILNDMTLLGVGSNAASVGNTTLGRIGTGYMYADWKSQVAYSTPNFNGFNATVGVTQSWNALSSNVTDATYTSVGNFLAAAVPASSGSALRGGSSPAFEGKVAYAWTGDVAGKVWASALSQKVQGLSTSNAWDLGATVTVAGLGLTGYYGEGRGTGTTVQFLDAFDTTGAKRDSQDWYVQATYVLPTTTKLGLSYGESKLDATANDRANGKQDYTKDMWTVGAYHPLTKHLNLVAEYSDVSNTALVTAKGETTAKTISLGAILFF